MSWSAASPPGPTVVRPGLQAFARALLQQLLRSGMLALALLAALWLTGQRMPWQASTGARAPAQASAAGGEHEL